MKTMYKKIVLRSMMLLMALGLVFGISSCSRDDDGDGGGSGGGNANVTLKMVGSAGVDLDVIVYGLNGNANTETSVNGNVWEKQITAPKTAGTTITLGGNGIAPDNNGSLKAQIFVDGTLKKEAVSNGQVLSATTSFTF